MRARPKRPGSTAGTPRKSTPGTPAESTAGTPATAPGSAPEPATKAPGFYQVWEDGQEFRIQGALALAIGDELHPLEFEDGHAVVRVNGLRYTVARQETKRRSVGQRAE
jgi:hypothetical protein